MPSETIKMRFRLPVGLSDGPPRSLCWRSAASTMMTAVARTAQIKRMISRRRVDQPSRLGEAPRIALSSASACSSDRAESIDRREAASKGVRSEGCHASTEMRSVSLFSSGRTTDSRDKSACNCGRVSSAVLTMASFGRVPLLAGRQRVARVHTRGVTWKGVGEEERFQAFVLLELASRQSLEDSRRRCWVGCEWGPVNATVLT